MSYAQRIKDATPTFQLACLNNNRVEALRHGKTIIAACVEHIDVTQNGGTSMHDSAAHCQAIAADVSEKLQQMGVRSISASNNGVVSPEPVRAGRRREIQRVAEQLECVSQLYTSIDDLVRRGDSAVAQLDRDVESAHQHVDRSRDSILQHYQQVGRPRGCCCALAHEVPLLVVTLLLLAVSFFFTA